MTKLEKILVQLIDIEDDYLTNNYGQRHCRWCGVETEMQNTHCYNENCPVYQARIILKKKKC